MEEDAEIVFIPSDNESEDGEYGLDDGMEEDAEVFSIQSDNVSEGGDDELDDTMTSPNVNSVSSEIMMIHSFQKNVGQILQITSFRRQTFFFAYF